MLKIVFTRQRPGKGVSSFMFLSSRREKHNFESWHPTDLDGSWYSLVYCWLQDLGQVP